MSERVTTVVVLTLGVLFAASLAVAGWALYDRFSLTDERRARQAAINQRMDMISLENCREIEALKQAQREEALRSFRDLDRTLRILRIPNSPEVVRAAKETRDRKLARFRAEPCPRRNGGS